MKLYEISEQLWDFKKSFENGEIPPEAFNDTLESIEGEFDRKADDIACLIKQMEADGNAIKTEGEALKKRADSKFKIAGRLKDYLKNQMQIMEKNAFETSRNKVTIRKNPHSVECLPEFLDWAKIEAAHLLKFKEPEPDKKIIKELLKSGDTVMFAKLVQTERIDIK